MPATATAVRSTGSVVTATTGHLRSTRVTAPAHTTYSSVQTFPTATTATAVTMVILSVPSVHNSTSTHTINNSQLIRADFFLLQRYSKRCTGNLGWTINTTNIVDIYIMNVHLNVHSLYDNQQRVR